MSEPFQFSAARSLVASAWLCLAIAAGWWCFASLGSSLTTPIAFILAAGCLGSAIASFRGRSLAFIARRWGVIAVVVALVAVLQLVFHEIIQ